MWDFRINHICANASKKRLVKVHPTGGANAKSLTASALTSQQGLWDMEMAREREVLRFNPSDLSIDSRLVRNCAKIVPVRNLFHLQRTELAQPGDGVFHERNRNIRWSSTMSDPHKIRGR